MDEISSHTYGTSLPLEPACWPTSLAHVPFLNPKTHMSSLRHTTPSEFPPLLPAPEGPPLRIQPQIQALHSLDRNLSTSRVLGDGRKSETQDESRCRDIGNPYNRRYNSARDEMRSEAAFKQLEAHIRERGPYVRIASSRLQAAMRMRNTLPYHLPQPSVPRHTPALKTMSHTSAGMDILSDSGATTMLKVGGRGVPRSAAKFASIKKPTKMYTVDQETGKGLREFLLAKGQELGHEERECKSISIHDFTPDIRTLAYQNVLLGHYDTEMGERVAAYEVDL
jgi:hypothetical protein